MTAAAVVVATETKTSYPQKLFEFSGAANAMDNSGVQDLFTIDTTCMVRMGLHIVVAINALASFEIWGLFHNSDAYVKLKSTAAHFTAPSGIMIDASGDLTTQAVGALGWLIMDVAGLEKVKIKANSGGASSTLAIFGCGL